MVIVNFEISLIIFVFNLKIKLLNNKLNFLFLILIVLNLSQVIRYKDKITLNYNYSTKNFKQHYKVIEKDNVKFIVNDEKQPLIYDGDNLFVTKYIDKFKIIKNNKVIKFRNLRDK